MSFIVAVLEFIVWLVKRIFAIRDQKIAEEDSKKADVIRLQQAATKGDEQVVQKTINDWRNG